MTRFVSIVFAAVAAAGASLGAAVDVPTWQIGDAWDVEKSYTLVSKRSDIRLTFRMTEIYTLTLTEISDRPTTNGGIERIYRRTRSNGYVVGSGTAQTAFGNFNIRWAPKGTADSGAMWRQVSDLALCLIDARVSGDIEAGVEWLGDLYVKIASIDMNMVAVSDPPGEEEDFPLDPAGETWTSRSVVYNTGVVQLTWNPDFPWFLVGGKPPDISLPLTLEQEFVGDFAYVGPDPLPGAPDAVRFQSAAETGWYSPAAEEVVRMEIPGGDAPEGGVGFQDELRLITGWRFNPDPYVREISFSPPRPYQGDWVRLNGKTSPNKAVTVTLLGQGGGGSGSQASTVSGANGRFLVYLIAPNHDDLTPASADKGSFGVEILVDGLGRKVVTLQVDRRNAAKPYWQWY
ncbi:MAG: hypothetical protein NTW86_13220 [Candidatus Sumerlaeota bacterium]|nr:hypothetical protein [Candidatus Sumerlaeota bacterium]